MQKIKAPIKIYSLLLFVFLIQSCKCQNTSQDFLSPIIKEQKTNLLIITLDTTRADRLGCYGYKNIHTPHIDSLAKEGVLFEEAFAVGPVTLPSHASIFTGKYPFRHGVRDNNIFSLSDKNETIAEVFLKKGYITTAFVASYILNHQFGLNQGFTFYNDEFIRPKQKGRLPVDRRAEEVSFLAGTWLDELEEQLEDTPFFLWLHYYDPHADYDPPHPYKTAYANPYDGEIAYMDDWIGYFFSQLKKRNKWDNTFVILVGDHGEGLGEYNEYTHGMFIYRSTMHVPLIMKFPHQEHSGKRIPTRISQVDIFPTILDFFDYSGKDIIDGKSLLPVIKGEEKKDRDVYGEVFIPRTFNWSEQKGLRAGDEFCIDSPIREYFKLNKKNGENNNLLPRNKEQASSCFEKLTQMQNISEKTAGNSVVLSQEMEQRLKALGYFISSEGIEINHDFVLADTKERIHLFNDQQRAYGLAELGRVNEAIKEYEKIIEVDADNPRFILELADLYSSVEKFKQADNLYQKAIALDEGNSRNYSLYARMLEAAQKNNDAIVMYEKALALNENDFISTFKLSLLYIQKEKWNKAKTLLKKAASLKKNAAVYNNLGYAIIKAENNFETGIKYIKKAAAIADDPFPYLKSLGSAYMNKGDYKRAAHYFEQALKIISDDIYSLQQLLQIYEKNEDSDQYQKILLRLELLNS